MYYNNIPIYDYILVAIIGLIVGNWTAWLNLRLPEGKKAFSKEYFSELKKGIPGMYIFMIITAASYVFLFYHYGVSKESLSDNFDLIKFMFLIPTLILTFVIDLRTRLIPNRLTLSIFEAGILITFIYGITNVNMAQDMILGMLVGIGMFLLITLIGFGIFGKEAMGWGDIKFMGAIGLFYGLSSTVEITLLSFAVAAVLSIAIVMYRQLILKKKDEYVAFGPFLSVSAFACIFIEQGLILSTFLNICKYLSNFIMVLIK
jgi:leader peptidase (prepilin peptidase)/N-methyltransferase